jgi:phospholipid/cholesterol/gamma-HCH transport system substrate-binding protein
MRDNKQYLIVGLFVLITATVLISVWLWFSSHNRQVYNTYMAPFKEAVDGVTTNSVVKYNGVEVGKVKKIELDPRDPHGVLVYLDILEQVSINKRAVASMKAQGVTGLFYISVNAPVDAKAGDNIKPHNDAPYPVIATKESLLSGLSGQAQAIANNLGNLSADMRVLLSDKNIKHVSNILSNLDKVSEAIASRSDEIGNSVKMITKILASIEKNSQNLNVTFSKIQDLTQTITDTATSTNGLISDVQNNTLQNINTVLLPNLNSTMSHMNQSSYQLEQLLKMLNQNPSVLVRGKTTKPLGPGE